jgi:hypothetical protein
MRSERMPGSCCIGHQTEGLASLVRGVAVLGDRSDSQRTVLSLVGCK